MNFNNNLKQKEYPILKIFLVVIFLSLVILPLIKLILFADIFDFISAVKTPQFLKSLSNSIKVSFVATGLSLVIAFTLAWFLQRSKIKYKELFLIIMTIPMLVPSISHSTGLIILFGTNGLITKVLNLSTSIYGFWGIVAGSVLYSFPFALLMIMDILKYEDYSSYEAANILGIPKLRQLTELTFSYLRKPMIAVTLATFTIIFTDYGVPVAIGGKYITLPVVMYQEVIGQLNFVKGSVIGLVLLIPAFVGFVFDFLNKDKGNVNFTTIPYQLSNNSFRDAVAYIFSIVVSTFVISINLSFVFLTFVAKYPVDLSFTFTNILKTFNMGGLHYLINSIIISLFVTLLGTITGFITSYLTARVHSKVSFALHLIIIISLAIPGIVLGLSYVLLFKQTFIYGTIGILIIVNLVHFFASPYLMMYNTLSKLNENLEDVGQTLGVSRFGIIKDIIIPQTKNSLIEMGSYLFINSMITISAVSFLSTTNNKPFSLMINQFEALMLMESAAVVTLILLLTNLLFKLFVWWIKKHKIKFN